MTTRNNSVLYNAALAGVQAANVGVDFTQITSGEESQAPDLSANAALAALAGEVDALIPYDAQLSVSGTGVLLVTPFAGSGTAAQILPVLSKPNLLTQIVSAAASGRTFTSSIPSAYSSLAAGIAAQYAASVTALNAS